MQPFRILDTETTGLDKDVDEILSIAIIDQDGTVLLDTCVTPIRHKTWERTQAIHGITPEHIFNQPEPGFPTLLQLAPLINSLLEGHQVFAYGADFDGKFLAPILSPQNQSINCIMRSFSEFRLQWSRKYNDWKRHSLVVAAGFVGYTWEKAAHSALGDALAALAVRKFLLAAEADFPPYKPKGVVSQDEFSYQTNPSYSRIIRKPSNPFVWNSKN